MEAEFLEIVSGTGRAMLSPARSSDNSGATTGNPQTAVETATSFMTPNTRRPPLKNAPLGLQTVQALSDRQLTPFKIPETPHPIRNPLQRCSEGGRSVLNRGLTPENRQTWSPSPSMTRLRQPDQSCLPRSLSCATPVSAAGTTPAAPAAAFTGLQSPPSSSNHGFGLYQADEENIQEQNGNANVCDDGLPSAHSALLKSLSSKVGFVDNRTAAGSRQVVAGFYKDGIVEVKEEKEHQVQGLKGFDRGHVSWDLKPRKDAVLGEPAPVFGGSRTVASPKGGSMDLNTEKVSMGSPAITPSKSNNLSMITTNTHIHTRSKPKNSCPHPKTPAIPGHQRQAHQGLFSVFQVKTPGRSASSSAANIASATSPSQATGEIAHMVSSGVSSAHLLTPTRGHEKPCLQDLHRARPRPHEHPVLLMSDTASKSQKRRRSNQAYGTAISKMLAPDCTADGDAGPESFDGKVASSLQVASCGPGAGPHLHGLFGELRERRRDIGNRDTVQWMKGEMEDQGSGVVQSSGLVSGPPPANLSGIPCFRADSQAVPGPSKGGGVNGGTLTRDRPNRKGGRDPAHTETPSHQSWSLLAAPDHGAKASPRTVQSVALKSAMANGKPCPQRWSFHVDNHAARGDAQSVLEIADRAPAEASSDLEGLHSCGRLPTTPRARLPPVEPHARKAPIIFHTLPPPPRRDHPSAANALVPQRPREVANRLFEKDRRCRPQRLGDKQSDNMASRSRVGCDLAHECGRPQDAVAAVSFASKRLRMLELSKYFALGGTVIAPERVFIDRRADRPDIGSAFKATRAMMERKQREAREYFKDNKAMSLEELVQRFADQSAVPFVEAFHKQRFASLATNKEPGPQSVCRKFECIGCKKRYKNRNGLTYHVQRCDDFRKVVETYADATHQRQICMCHGARCNRCEPMVRPFLNLELRLLRILDKVYVKLYEMRSSDILKMKDELDQLQKGAVKGEGEQRERHRDQRSRKIAPASKHEERTTRKRRHSASVGSSFGEFGAEFGKVASSSANGKRARKSTCNTPSKCLTKTRKALIAAATANVEHESEQIDPAARVSASAIEALRQTLHVSNQDSAPQPHIPAYFSSDTFCAPPASDPNAKVFEEGPIYREGIDEMVLHSLEMISCLQPQNLTAAEGGQAFAPNPLNPPQTSEEGVPASGTQPLNDLTSAFAAAASAANHSSISSAGALHSAPTSINPKTIMEPPVGDAGGLPMATANESNNMDDDLFGSNDLPNQLYFNPSFLFTTTGVDHASSEDLGNPCASLFDADQSTENPVMRNEMKTPQTQPKDFPSSTEDLDRLLAECSGPLSNSSQHHHAPLPMGGFLGGSTQSLVAVDNTGFTGDRPVAQLPPPPTGTTGTATAATPSATDCFEANPFLSPLPSQLDPVTSQATAPVFSHVLTDPTVFPTDGDLSRLSESIVAAAAAVGAGNGMAMNHSGVDDFAARDLPDLAGGNPSTTDNSNCHRPAAHNVISAVSEFGPADYESLFQFSDDICASPSTGPADVTSCKQFSKDGIDIEASENLPVPNGNLSVLPVVMPQPRANVMAMPSVAVLREPQSTSNVLDIGMAGGHPSSGDGFFDSDPAFIKQA